MGIYHGYLSSPPFIWGTIVFGSFPFPTQYSRPCTLQSCNKKDPLRYPHPEVLQILDWISPMLEIYVLVAIQFSFLHIFWQHRVPFPMLCRSKEEIISIPFVAKWVLLVWLECLVSVLGSSRSYTPIPLCNIMHKTHIWYTIFLGRSWPRLVLQQTNELSAWEHYQFIQLLLLAPSFICFHLPRVLALAVLSAGRKTSQ